MRRHDWCRAAALHQFGDQRLAGCTADPVRLETRPASSIRWAWQAISRLTSPSGIRPAWTHSTKYSGPLRRPSARAGTSICSPSGCASSTRTNRPPSTTKPALCPSNSNPYGLCPACVQLASAIPKAPAYCIRMIALSSTGMSVLTSRPLTAVTASGRPRTCAARAAP